MRKRIDIEELEDTMLAPHAMRSRDSEGRRYDNSPHDVRTCYQRDRDRIVHSTAFRKLEYKTQVFVILEGDYYRNRLTHTIEVAQIARTIGRCLCLNEDLIEAIALAHDLGHPPFGHAGEEALDQLMKSRGFCNGFNHNFRSFEIVTKFEKRYPGFPGLDLSAEVLVGILKHQTAYDISRDLPEYSRKGETLEAQVVDIADALAYLAHDIDDGLTSGLITPNDLISSELFRGSYEQIASELDEKDTEMVKYQVVKFLIDAQAKDLLAESKKRIDSQNFVSSESVKNYNANPENASVIAFSEEMNKNRDFLQGLLMEKLYKHYRVVRMTEKAKRIIREIFSVYDANPNQLPYDVYSRNLSISDQEKVSILGNYIAGMTDRSALDEHKKLFNPYQKV